MLSKMHITDEAISLYLCSAMIIFSFLFMIIFQPKAINIKIMFNANSKKI